eukprot:g13345.t2
MFSRAAEPAPALVVGFAHPAPPPLPCARLRRRRQPGSTDAFRGGDNTECFTNISSFDLGWVAERGLPRASRGAIVLTASGEGGAGSRAFGATEEEHGAARRRRRPKSVQSAPQRAEGSTGARLGRGGGGSRGSTAVRSSTAAAPPTLPEEDKVPAIKGEWEAVLQERLERKLRKPSRKRRARGAAAAAASATAAAAEADAPTTTPKSRSTSPCPTRSSPPTDWLQQQRQQGEHHQRGGGLASSFPQPAATLAVPPRTTRQDDQQLESLVSADAEESTTSEIAVAGAPPGESGTGIATGSEEQGTRVKRGGGEGNDTAVSKSAGGSSRRRNARRRVAPPPLKRWPPGGPFGASKTVAWHAQQVVQSAVTPMQAMRAVLDRPHRSNFVSVSTAVNRVAKLTAARRRGGGLKGEEEPKYLGVLLRVTEELVDADLVNARNLAQLLWSVAKLGNPEACDREVLTHPEKDKGLREIGPLRFGSGTPREEGGSPLPAECPRQSQLPSLLAGKLSERAMECKPGELAMAAWALAVLGERDENLLSAIAEEVSLRAHEFKGKELGNIVWAFAVLDYRNKVMLGAVAEVLSPEPLQWRGRVSWEWKQGARSSSGRRSKGHWKATIDRSWGMKVNGGTPPPPPRPAAMVMAEKAKLFAEQENGALAADSAAADGDGDGSSSPEAGEATGDAVGGSTAFPNSGGNVDNFGSASGPAPGMAAQTGGRSKRAGVFSSPRVHWSCASEVQVGSVVLTPQDLAMLSWGFSALSQECLPCQPAAYRALAVLAKAARECVGNFRPQDISMVSMALARMSWDDPRLMKAMATRTAETLRAFKPQELANTAWAYARLYIRDPRFWSSLQKQAKRMLAGPGMRAQEIANLAWALAVMGEADVDLLKDLLRSAQAQRKDITLIESHQLYQVYLLWGKNMPELWEELDPKFLQVLKRRWTDNQQRTKRSSLSHLEVSQTLDLMQISHENESEHDIDIEVVGVGLASEDWDFRSFSAGTGPNPADPAEVRLKLALEVDGPAHFTKNTARPLGHMVLKHRTLSKMGWTVVSIPFLEWDPIPFWSSMEKKRYLQRKLGITRTIFFGGIDCSKFKGWTTRLDKPSRFN